jgi:dTDP-4-dehydrorhamnose 3,5-epimerase
LISLEDFVDDAPWQPSQADFAEVTIDHQIEGVTLFRLHTHSDGRGDLTVLMSNLNNPSLQPPHVYLVTAAAHSVRAWVYHKRQYDRLAYIQGTIRVVLYDLRPDSKTFGQLNVIDVGADNKVLLTIPPFVVHGVQNRGAQAAQFVNMPTKAYDPAHPDKSRLPKSHPGIPYVFD